MWFLSFLSEIFFNNMIIVDEKQHPFMHFDEMHAWVAHEYANSIHWSQKIHDTTKICSSLNKSTIKLHIKCPFFCNNY